MNYKIVDYTKEYGSIMQFDKNKSVYVHRWYPFVEGYSKEFIHKIVNEFRQNFPGDEIIGLDPFAGSGTTPLELQNMGIKCFSFEVSPFMYDIACCKMENTYTIETFDRHTNQLKNYCKKEHIYTEDQIQTNFKTLVEHDGINKWIFNKSIRIAILDILGAIDLIPSNKYRRLFKIALASILLQVSNVYRNGKCVSYKDNWNEQSPQKKIDVFDLYFDKLQTVFRHDINIMQDKRKKSTLKICNKNICINGDCRKLILNKIQDNSINLVITSPPYLNSRDYTDTYMVELKSLGYMSNLEDLKKLRQKTLRSHVQIKWGEVDCLEICELKQVISKLEQHKDEFWNNDLLNMIKAYFTDMNQLFKALHNKMKKDGMIFFNVANSAYYNIEIKVDEIICKIAENNGFNVKEIREARRVRTSSQQKNLVKGLRESVLIIQNQ